MVNFYKLKILLENSNNVIIDIDSFKKILYKKIKDFLEEYEAKTNRIMNLKPNIYAIENKLKDYPKIKQLITAIQNSDKNSLRNLVRDLNDYAENLSMDHRMEIFDVIRHIDEIEDKVYGRSINEKDQYDYADQQIKKTYENMMVVKNIIENALSRMDYNGSAIKIIPQPTERDGDFVSDSSFGDIVVGTNRNALFTFSLENNSLHIDDILEGDDEEFFNNNSERQDYYNLISALQNPNRVKKNVILTLYTARPVGDREFYKNTNHLPANVFLTNNLDHAEGLAHELGGNETRDIYKVKINSKYLVKTLDGPIKYYMVIKDSPVESIELF